MIDSFVSQKWSQSALVIRAFHLSRSVSSSYGRIHELCRFRSHWMHSHSHSMFPNPIYNIGLRLKGDREMLTTRFRQFSFVDQHSILCEAWRIEEMLKASTESEPSNHLGPKGQHRNFNTISIVIARKLSLSEEYKSLSLWNSGGAKRRPVPPRLFWSISHRFWIEMIYSKEDSTLFSMTYFTCNVRFLKMDESVSKVTSREMVITSSITR
jgi:hypothetical protein